MSGGRFAMLCLADALGREAAILRGEPYESKLEAWVKGLNLRPAFLWPNPCSEVYAGPDRVACYFFELESCQRKGEP